MLLDLSILIFLLDTRSKDRTSKYNHQKNVTNWKVSFCKTHCTVYNISGIVHQVLGSCEFHRYGFQFSLMPSFNIFMKYLPYVDFKYQFHSSCLFSYALIPNYFTNTDLFHADFPPTQIKGAHQGPGKPRAGCIVMRTPDMGNVNYQVRNQKS